MTNFLFAVAPTGHDDGATTREYFNARFFFPPHTSCYKLRIIVNTLLRPDPEHVARGIFLYPGVTCNFYYDRVNNVKLYFTFSPGECLEKKI